MTSLYSVDLGTEEIDGFQLDYTRGQSGDDYLYHSVQIGRSQHVLSRITVYKPGLTDDEAVIAIRRRALEWIDDFRQRVG
ncbi:MAG: hypothetical protein KA795_04790 [Burkholderiaceae bacterium]|nr:hypothetical protein [Burkholderiaceae bacterium]